MLIFSGNFDLQILQLFILQWCCVDNLTGFSCSREKLMATKLRTIIATDIVKRFSEKINDHLVRLQHIATARYSLESVLLGTHLLFRESWQTQIDDHLV